MFFIQAVYIFICLFIAGLGIFVFIRNPSNVINRRFCVFNLVLSVWIFFILLTISTEEVHSATTRLRLVYCAALFIPSSFFFFTSVFPDRIEIPRNRFLKKMFFSVSVLLAFTTPFIVKSVEFDGRIPHAKYSSLFPLFWLYFIPCMVYALYDLFKKGLYYHGVRRLQVQYLFFGVAIYICIGIITNFFLPIIGIWHVEMFAPLAAIPIPVTVAYAILKYHLLDISVIIKRSTVYIIQSVIMSAIYFVVALVLGNMLPVSEYKDTITGLFSITIVVFVFVTARESIQHIIEKTIFHTRYSHPKILRDSTAMFSSIHDMDGLLRYAIQYLYDSVGIEKICILLKDVNSGNYVQRATINFTQNETLFLSHDSPVVTWLSQHKTFLSKDQLNRFAYSKFEGVIEEMLVSLNVDSSIPILLQNELFGMIFLGKKINKKIFTQEDVQMYMAFSGQLAMAVNNARLYTGLNESKVYRDNILQSLKNGVIVFDINEEVTLINNEAKKILGLGNSYSKNTIIKALGTDIYKLLRNTLKSDMEYTDVEAYIDRDDKKTPYGVTTGRLKTEEGEKLGALMILTDLSELKLLQSEKQQVDRLAYLGVLAANIAHEIKNPLVAINTYFQLLPQRKNDEEFTQNFQKIAIKEIGRINRIIEGLLDLTKPSKSVMHYIDPHAIIIEIVNLLKHTTEEKGVEITVSLANNKYQLMADEDKVKQVLINILHNSIEAFSNKGNIHINTYVKENLFEFKILAKESPGRIFFSFAPAISRNIDMQYFMIKISDDGMGIPAKKIPQIFEPFFTNKDRGTGLGLAVVYRIIKDHEGCIYIESKEEEGTSFHIGLPLSRSNTFQFLEHKPVETYTSLW